MICLNSFAVPPIPWYTHYVPIILSIAKGQGKFMDEQFSHRRLRDCKILAVIIFNFVAVWFLLSLMSFDFKHKLATMEIAGLILVPLFAFYARSSWPAKRWAASAIVLPVLWFATYSLLHETSHLVGVILVGGTIVDHHLIPQFWKGEFTVGWMQSKPLQDWRDVIPGLCPYLRDILFLTAGFFILGSKRIRNCFLVGLLFTLCCLSPMFDIVDNYLNGYVLGRASGNDFLGTAMKIGATWTNLIGVLCAGYAVYVTGRLLWLYRDFPGRVARA
jgi:hypothetical protein